MNKSWFNSVGPCRTQKNRHKNELLKNLVIKLQKIHLKNERMEKEQQTVEEQNKGLNKNKSKSKNKSKKNENKKKKKKKGKKKRGGGKERGVAWLTATG